MASDPDTWPRSRSGFTLLEIALVISIIGLLAAVAGSQYQHFIEKARVASAIAEMQAISRVLDAQQIDGSELPEDLASLDVAAVDPWGNPYEYLKIEGTLPPGQTDASSGLPHVAAGDEPKPRKDQFLVPINTDYDLYSMGADGESEKQLDRKVSRDDVIRAANGSYFGLARDF